MLLSGWAAVLAVTLTLVPVVIVRLNFDYSDGLSSHFVFAMTVACVVSALPSFAAGVVIAMAIRAHAEVVGRIYAVDLVAAGLGALAVVPAIWMINPPHLVVALGLLAAVTAVVIGPDLRARRWAGLAGVVPAAVLIAAPLTSIITVPVPGLDLAGTIRSEVWTPLSRVIGVIPGQTNSFGLVFYDRVERSRSSTTRPVSRRPTGRRFTSARRRSRPCSGTQASRSSSAEGAGVTSTTSARRASTTST